MKYLYECFNNSISAQITESGEVLIGETAFNPVDILQSDDYAYENEFLNWRDTDWLPSQISVLDEILEIENNKMRFHDICVALSKNTLVPFIGSGMSAPSGIPVWSDFLLSLGRQSYIDENDLINLLSTHRYEEIANYIMGNMPRRLFNEQVEQKLRLLDDATIVGPINHLPELFQSIVITTNLDNLLEKLYQSRKVGFNYTLIGENIKYFNELCSSSGSFLFKLHGDCSSVMDRVITTDDYDNFYNQNALCLQELENVYCNHHVLFLGCSLEQDRVLDIFKRIAHDNDDLPKHYCFLQHPGTDEDRKAKDHFLAEYGIFPIWYDGDHNESIEALFVGIK